jgi:hypothetical protein
MAINTLRGIEEIDGYKVIVMDELREKYPDKFSPDGQMNWKWFEQEIRPNYFIYIRNDKSSISFTMQNGSVQENGVNGCQIDTLVHAALLMLENLYKDDKSKCIPMSINALLKAILHLLKAR